jgi:hypothetical protein
MLVLSVAELPVVRKVRRQDLHAGYDLRHVAERDGNHIENDAVEIEEYAGETNVEAIVAMKGADGSSSPARLRRGAPGGIDIAVRAVCAPL